MAEIPPWAKLSFLVVWKVLSWKKKQKVPLEKTLLSNGTYLRSSGYSYCTCLCRCLYNLHDETCRLTLNDTLALQNRSCELCIGFNRFFVLFRFPITKLWCSWTWDTTVPSKWVHLRQASYQIRITKIANTFYGLTTHLFDATLQ